MIAGNQHKNIFFFHLFVFSRGFLHLSLSFFIFILLHYLLWNSGNFGNGGLEKDCMILAKIQRKVFQSGSKIKGKRNSIQTSRDRKHDSRRYSMPNRQTLSILMDCLRIMTKKVNCKGITILNRLLNWPMDQFKDHFPIGSPASQCLQDITVLFFSLAFFLFIYVNFGLLNRDDEEHGWRKYFVKF